MLQAKCDLDIVPRVRPPADLAAEALWLVELGAKWSIGVDERDGSCRREEGARVGVRVALDVVEAVVFGHSPSVPLVRAVHLAATTKHGAQPALVRALVHVLGAPVPARLAPKAHESECVHKMSAARGTTCVCEICGVVSTRQ